MVAGYNAFDVTAAVTGNGRRTFALLQETLDTRIYWPALEHPDTSIRPKLTVTYAPSGAPGTPATSGTPGTPGTPGWRLAWEDNFDGPSLDTSKWTARPAQATDFELPSAAQPSAGESQRSGAAFAP